MLSSDFHKDFNRLIISTHEISPGGLSFSHEIQATALNCLIAEQSLEEFSWHSFDNISLEFFLERESKKTFKIKIKADFILQSVCVRCLKPVDYRLLIDFSTRLIEEEQIKKREMSEQKDWYFDSDSMSGHVDPDLNVEYFSKQRIDLPLILREQIFMSVPTYPACGSHGALGTEICELKVGPEKDPELTHAKVNPFVKMFSNQD